MISLNPAFQTALVNSKEYNVHDCTPHEEIQFVFKEGLQEKNGYSHKLWILCTASKKPLRSDTLPVASSLSQGYAFSGYFTDFSMASGIHLKMGNTFCYIMFSIDFLGHLLFMLLDFNKRISASL